MSLRDFAPLLAIADECLRDTSSLNRELLLLLQGRAPKPLDHIRHKARLSMACTLVRGALQTCLRQDVPETVAQMRAGAEARLYGEDAEALLHVEMERLHDAGLRVTSGLPFFRTQKWAKDILADVAPILQLNEGREEHAILPGVLVRSAVEDAIGAIDGQLRGQRAEDEERYAWVADHLCERAAPAFVEQIVELFGDEASYIFDHRVLTAASLREAQRSIYGNVRYPIMVSLKRNPS